MKIKKETKRKIEIENGTDRTKKKRERDTTPFLDDQVENGN